MIEYPVLIAGISGIGKSSLIDYAIRKRHPY